MMRRASKARLEKAERSVIRAAVGILDKDGWSFGIDHRVAMPMAMRRLENAIWRLLEARKEAKRGK